MNPKALVASLTVLLLSLVAYLWGLSSGVTVARDLGQEAAGAAIFVIMISLFTEILD